MKPASIWKLFSINSGWIGLSFMWNSLHVMILPAVLLLYVNDEHKNSILGLLTGFGLFIAMIIQPLAGALSDRWVSRWGRRRPLITTGTLLDVLFLALIASVGGLPAIAIGYILLQFSSNIAHGALQGLMPDVLSPTQLGRGSAFKVILDMAALVVASLWMGNLLNPDNPQLLIPMGIVISILLISTGITVFGVREQPSPKKMPAPNQTAWRDMFQVDLKQNRLFAWLILGRLFFLLGIFGIQAFAQYYIRDTLPGYNPVKLTGDLMAAIVVGLVMFSLAAGYISDRLGTRLVHSIAAVLVAGGSLLMNLANSPTSVLLCGMVVGAGIGLFLTANWALANTLAPPADAGKYLGLTNLATAGGGALSRLFGPIIDWVNNLQPGSYLGYNFLFIASAAFAVLGWLLLRNSFGKRTPLSPIVREMPGEVET